MKSGYVFNIEPISIDEAIAITGGDGKPTTSTSFFYDVAYYLGMFYASMANYCDMYSYGAPVAY